MKTLRLVSLCVALFLPAMAQAYSDELYKELAVFSEVLEVVERHYVNPVKEKPLIQGAMQGLLQTLDPHTVYLPPKIYKHFTSDTRGRFGGLGIEVSVRDGVLTVISPLEGTPAWEAGIKAGDKILAIDGDPTKKLSLGEAIHKMRGPVNKKIQLTIWREGKTKPRVVTLVRKTIHVPSIKSEDLGNGYGYFRITQFQQESSKDLKKAIEDLASQSSDGLKGIVLDLRDNPGGLLNEAVKVSDLFIKKGVIVSTRGHLHKEEVKKARSGGTLKSFPVVVLINRGSASASEIVAGALQDHRRAKLMGMRSFGKGSVQTLINLQNGGAVKITVAHYFTPKNRLIDGKGIEPDVVLDQKLYTKKHKHEVPEEAEQKKVSREEFYAFQKQEAIDFLKKMR